MSIIRHFHQRIKEKYNISILVSEQADMGASPLILQWAKVGNRNRNVSFC